MATIKKPTITAQDALSFAEGAENTVPIATKPKSRGAVKKPSGSKLKSGQIPDGDVRLTANIRQDLHFRVKVEAARRRISIGDLIEELIEREVPTV